MDGDGDGGGGGGFNDYGSSDQGDRGPGYNEHSRDDNPFEPSSRNNDPFSVTEDLEEKYRNERERVKETDVDEIRPYEDDQDEQDGRPAGLAAMLGGSLASSMADGMADKHHEKLRNGKAPYSTFKMNENDTYVPENSNCVQDCVYYGVLCCQCSIL